MLREICKQRRLELGISQTKLAKKIGVRNATISDFETGKKGLNSKTLELILKELGINFNTKEEK